MKSILILEDERRIRKIYRELLINEDFEVLEALNANEANKILKEKQVNLILLDIKMPEISGLDFYRILHLFYKNTKVIVASVYCLDEQKEMVPDADGYYDKSEGLKVLLERIHKVLNG